MSDNKSTALEERVSEFITRYHALMAELGIKRYVGVADFGGNIFQIAAGGGDYLWQSGVGEFLQRQACLVLLQSTEMRRALPVTDGPQTSGGEA